MPKRDTPIDYGDNRHMSIRFPSWMHYVLDYFSDELDQSKSDFIRWAVIEHVNSIILQSHNDCLVYGPKEASIAERFFHVYIKGEKEWTQGT